MPTIFTQIIAGVIPSHMVYEDDLTFVFLDNSPKAPGHVLVVPKTECDKFYELEEPYYTAVFQTTKKIAKAIEQVFGVRVIAKIIGTDIPHVHVHVLPLKDKFSESDLPKTPQEFDSIAQKIMLALK
jgi:histidine triad (HIT) family protein